MFFCLEISAQQDSIRYSKLLSTAQKYFDNEEFDKALPLFIKLDSIKPGNFEINYNIGACYLNTQYQKTKGIPYLEFAIKKGKNLIPMAAFKDLGTLYHLNYQFDKAIEQYNRYLKLAYKDEDGVDEVKHMIEVSNNAQDLIKDTIDYEILRVDSPVNTSMSELNPFVSADNMQIYFTRDYRSFNGLVFIDSLSEIMYSSKKSGKWSNPVKLIFGKTNVNYKSISIAGISPGGDRMFTQIIDQEDNADLYYCTKTGDTFGNFKKLGNDVNSKYWEGGASITPDGSDLYFSSSRPGGYGGKDIYKITRDETGKWTKPMNLGPIINTKYDEEAPFIHPDKRTLFFSSNGHNTMGGSDIFRTFFISSEEGWAMPENLGYPINSTYDDKSFILTADGSSGYFSSSQFNEKGLHDIFLVNFYKTIPLTMVKGKILTGTPPEPAVAKIKVFDKEKNERIKYIYDPNPYTGEYLMIFPPGKNYDMLIESPGYKPHLINIYIPNQTYFYELFQEIHLVPIYMSENNEQIGEEINVKNIFYDIYHNEYSDSIYHINDVNPEKNYDKLLGMINDLIETSDSIGLYKLDFYSQMRSNRDTITDKGYNKLLDLIEGAIETEDSVALEVLNYNTMYAQSVGNVYFYDKSSNTDQLVKYYIAGDTIQSFPVLITHNKYIDNNNLVELIEDSTEIVNTKKNQKQFIYKTIIYFETNKNRINESYYPKLNDVADLLMSYEDLYVEINGYADSKGSASFNQKLSEKRAIAVLDYLEKKKLKLSNIIVKGFGESESQNEVTDEDRMKNRKVEILIYKMGND